MALKERCEVRLKAGASDVGLFAKWYVEDVTELWKRIAELEQRSGDLEEELEDG